MCASPSALMVPHVAGGGTSRGVGLHWPVAMPPPKGSVGAVESVAGAPGEDGPRDFLSPEDAPLTRLTAILSIVAQRGEGRVIDVVERLLRDRNRPTSAVCAAAMTAARRDAPARGVAPDEERLVGPLDAVEGIEHRGVHDGTQTLTRRVRGVRDNEGVDEDLIPLQHLVRALFPSGARRAPMRGMPPWRWRCRGMSSWRDDSTWWLSSAGDRQARTMECVNAGSGGEHPQKVREIPAAGAYCPHFGDTAARSSHRAASGLERRR